jgi:vitamin B12/bleomycin/antimicrobial peptide transport system ATP-binding/permease protein
MALPYFYEQWKGRLLFAVMVVLTLLNSGVRVLFSYLVRDFWSSLSDGEEEEFYSILRNFLLAMVLLAPINVLYRYQRQMLAIHWREWMTGRVLELYFSHRVYYGLERSHSKNNDGTVEDNDLAGPIVVDNPDQRITEDVRSFTEFSLTLFLTVLMGVVDLVCFSVILYTIMPELFLAIALFATVGTTLTIFIGKVLVQLNFEKLQKEADFRFSLVRVRENAESIAFLQGEPVEKETVRHRFARVIANMHSLNAAVRNLESFTTYYDYITWLLPILVIAPTYFQGEVELGIVQQAISSFSHVLDDMSILVTQWESLTEFSAGIDRLYTFLVVAQHLVNPDPSSESSPLLPPPTQELPPISQQSLSNKNAIHLHYLEQCNPCTIVIENLTLATPNHRILIQNLNLSVKKGQNLLICGPSGSGKSSLLRALAGLWSSGSGSIYTPPKSDIYFLPQKAYCSMGSLRHQLLYPKSPVIDPLHLANNAPNLSDQDLLDILQAVDLADLPKRAGCGDAIHGLDKVMDWSNTLSLGEQQRLAFGRLLVYRPRFVILDESSSAMDMDAERKMYELLRKTLTSCGSHISYISVGHRPSLAEYHHSKLTLQKGGYSMDVLP